jgi:hypothetical protein
MRTADAMNETIGADALCFLDRVVDDATPGVVNQCINAVLSLLFFGAPATACLESIE